ncbi:MAG: (Fe-S)-binding protein [Desulfobacterota bacterium]|jgi:heterodisulfide reductase subunit D|nr:(Fe-S)-binding protein [Thermodesulfobacteriota bacterium]
MEDNDFEGFDRCAKCGICLAQCPVYKESLLEKASPRGKIQLAKFYKEGRMSLSEGYRGIFGQCLLCGACATVCPSGMKAHEIVLRIREEIVGVRGFDDKGSRLVSSILQSHNISEEDNEERGEWREELKDLPGHRYEKERAKVAYFVGCVASFFPMVQKIPRNMARILDQAGVDFAFLGGKEWCCGFPLLAAGAPAKMQEMVRHNVEAVRRLAAEKVLFSCPSCYRTWKESYHTQIVLQHTADCIHELIQSGRLQLRPLAPLRVAYHDSCDLGRHVGVFDTPREVLQSIPGVTLVELEHNRAGSLCCGGGGNLETASPELAGKLARAKIEEILQSEADVVVTACQQCVRTIASSARRQKLDLKVMDISELVCKALESD